MDSLDSLDSWDSLDSLDEEMSVGSQQSLASVSSTSSRYSQISASPSKFWSCNFSKPKPKFNSASGRKCNLMSKVSKLFQSIV